MAVDTLVSKYLKDKEEQVDDATKNKESSCLDIQKMIQTRKRSTEHENTKELTHYVSRTAEVLSK